MTVTVTTKTRTIVNGTTNDATPVEANFTELYNNDTTLANAINANVIPIQGFKQGCVPSYTSANQITVTKGNWIDSTSAVIINLSSATGVNLAASGSQGLDSSSKAANTFYYLWLCQGTSGTTLVFSGSTTTPSLPSGYNTYKALLPFACKTDASANMIPFNIGPGWPTQPLVLYRANMAYNAGGGATSILAAGNATSSTAVSCSGFVPTALSNLGYIDAFYAGSASSVFTIYDNTISSIIEQKQLGGAAGGDSLVTKLYVTLDSSGNLNYVTNNSGANLSLSVNGFVVNQLP